MSVSSPPEYLARVLKKIGTRATVITGQGHRNKCHRLEELGFARVLSPGQAGTVAVLTDAGSAWLASLA